MTKEVQVEEQKQPSNGFVTVAESIKMIFYHSDLSSFKNKKWRADKQRIIYRLIERGELKKKKMFGKTILIYKNSVDKFISE